ncbi:Hypothetical protein, putative [Bodo saltans]|uniref:PABS domain-containing protein n=1 Tax=Bodo saltans TaxID=75058 RepID=A0A0S4JHR3_BODSA|nr:Hypothetical protein, putative [Bodo saltans]|eukprot:CUG88780.1 Hypothetical protein, putative [Bodo saltans]
MSSTVATRLLDDEESQTFIDAACAATSAAGPSAPMDDASLPHDVKQIEQTTTSSSSEDVDHNIMLAAVRKEVSLASEDWYELTSLQEIHKKKPIVIKCITHIQQKRPAECFTDFFVVLAHHVLTVDPNPSRRVTMRQNEQKSSTENEESGSSNDNKQLVTLAFHTLHFVHRKQPDVGYEVQSVWIPGAPLRLQCYPRLNLQYLFMQSMRVQYGPPPDSGEIWDASKLRLPQSGDVVILGMGGNVMANCLVHLLPHTVPIHVVEIEPSVVAVCSVEGLLPAASNFHVHVCDVVVALARLEDSSCSLIILDCFDPLQGDMMAHANWLRQVKAKLKSTGAVVVNMHCTPNAKFLAVFVEVFGKGNVEVLEFGATPAQVAIVCSATPVAEISKDQMNSLAYTMCRCDDLAAHADALCFVTKLFVTGHKSVKFMGGGSDKDTFNVRVWKCGAL